MKGNDASKTPLKHRKKNIGFIIFHENNNEKYQQKHENHENVKQQKSIEPKRLFLLEKRRLQRRSWDAWALNPTNRLS